MTGIMLRRSPGRRRWQFQMPDGSWSVDYTHPDAAITRAEAEFYRASLRKRPCLTCGATFKSEGAHNRLCGRCRVEKAEWHGV